MNARDGNLPDRGRTAQSANLEVALQNCLVLAGPGNAVDRGGQDEGGLGLTGLWSSELPKALVIALAQNHELRFLAWFVNPFIGKENRDR
jgi:hypothetical protein